MACAHRGCPCNGRQKMRRSVSVKGKHSRLRSQLHPPTTPLLQHPALHPMQTIEDRLVQLGITLPPLPQAMANYVLFTLADNLLYVSGQGPKTKEGDWIRGQVGKDLTVEQGYEAARLTGIQILAVINGALGSLNRVKRILKVNGFVNSGPEFRDHPAVINGCSDLFVELLGDNGRHARAAIGVSSLPQGIAVEIEAIVDVHPAS
jgi:enamine deaminase RidA (YjgF/YER057c/UK114 family)